jgi:FkbH-like protein
MNFNNLTKQTKESHSWLIFRRTAEQIKRAALENSIEDNYKLKIAFLSSYTIDPLIDFLIVKAAENNIVLDIYKSDFGQLNQEFLNSQGGLYKANPDITILAAEAISLDENPILAAEQIIRLSRVFKNNSKNILVVCTFIPQIAWPLHILETENEKFYHKANNLLKEKFQDDPQIQICDIDSLVSYFGYRNALSPEMMSMAKIPFSEPFLELLSLKIIGHIRAKLGLTKKCLVLDCDNTLWGGIIGEDGIEGIKIGPDWPGREFVSFQKALLELYNQGIILAINSRNNYDDVIKVLREHPFMVLREGHFASITANWESKPTNMHQIANEINIGLDSMVFVDDSPVERELMRQMLPEVCTIEMPSNPSLFENTLRETNLFAKAFITEEDAKRGQIYAAQRRRNQLQKETPTLDDFLKSLEMIISIRPAEQKDIKRVSQLTNRTNQFNLTTRRYSETDIATMIEDKSKRIYALSLKDKFGDNGMVGVAIVNCSADKWYIDTFLMSCRVIGRQSEDALFDKIVRDSAAQDVSILETEYVPTEKNKLVAEFWNRLGLTLKNENNGTKYYRLIVKNYPAVEFKYLKFE